MKNIFVRINNQGKRRPHIRNIVWAILVLTIVFRGITAVILNQLGRDFHEGSDTEYLRQVTAASAASPNIILIYVDDLGYGDLSITGSRAISTPNIDSLGETGILLTNYYAPAPVCSASRAGLLTGRYPLRAHTPGVFLDTESLIGHLASAVLSLTGTVSSGVQGIPQDEILLPEVLQKAEYETALVGKWHLGIQKAMRPTSNGFDLFHGALYSNDMPPYRIYKNDVLIHDAPFDQSTLTQELTNVAVDFIEENKDKPFFLYYASPFPHYPANASEEFTGTSKAGLYGDCVQEIDWSVGQILDVLAANDLEENTLVVFTSDNGPWYEGSTAGLRGRKDTTFDGGQHAPFLASMPGTLPAGAVMDGLVSGLDVFPTVLAMAGIPLPDDRIIDGLDMSQYWAGQAESPRTKLFLNKDAQSFAMIDDHYKYMDKTGSDNGSYWMTRQGPFLFDLSADPDEAYDVSLLYPDVARQMKSELDSFKTSLKENLRGWK